MDNRGIVDWNIQIDRIVIEGIVLTSYQQRQLKESLEGELGRMFDGRGAKEGIRAIQGKGEGATVVLRGAGSVPMELGKQIAATVFKNLSGNK
ncbi:MAG: hypothetical protein J0H74_30185 [Chitinophagaceae bacterium]|nr:hypothetical protein [Chitinophagaceae bacterium]